MTSSEHKLFYSNFMKGVQDLIPKPPSVVTLPDSPKRIADLLPTIETLIANVQFLVGENTQQKDVINNLLFENSKLKPTRYQQVNQNPALMVTRPLSVSLLDLRRGQLLKRCSATENFLKTFDPGINLNPGIYLNHGTAFD